MTEALVGLDVGTTGVKALAISPDGEVLASAEEHYGKEALVRYFQDALIAAFPSASGEKVPPTYKYFVEIVNILRDMRPEKLTDKSILCGSPQHIVDTLKTVEAAGVAEVILYFNYGQKPHAQVKEQMERFMTEIAPHF